MAAHGVPVQQLSFAEYHQASLLARHADAFLPPTTNHAAGHPNTTGHAGNTGAMPTSAPAPVPHCYDHRSTAQNVHLSTGGRGPAVHQTHSHGSFHLPISPAFHHFCSNSIFSTTTSGLAYPSTPSSSTTITSSSSSSSSPSSSPSQQPPRCAGCARTFANAQTLKRHRREVASCPHYGTLAAKQRYMCSRCKATFQRRDGLKQHLRERCGRTALEAEQDVGAWYGAGRRRRAGRGKKVD